MKDRNNNILIAIIAVLIVFIMFILLYVDL